MTIFVSKIALYIRCCAVGYLVSVKARWLHNGSSAHYSKRYRKIYLITIASGEIV